VEKEMMDEKKAVIDSKINQLSKVLGRINEVKKNYAEAKS